MTWIQNIQNKPRAAKIRIMWVVGVVVVILLIAAWVISERFHKQTPVDTTLFKTIGSGVNNVKENYGK
jgi:predicted permease